MWWILGVVVALAQDAGPTGGDAPVGEGGDPPADEGGDAPADESRFYDPRAIYFHRTVALGGASVSAGPLFVPDPTAFAALETGFSFGLGRPVPRSRHVLLWLHAEVHSLVAFGPLRDATTLEIGSGISAQLFGALEVQVRAMVGSQSTSGSVHLLLGEVACEGFALSLWAKGLVNRAPAELPPTAVSVGIGTVDRWTSRGDACGEGLER